MVAQYKALTHGKLDKGERRFRVEMAQDLGGDGSCHASGTGYQAPPYWKTGNRQYWEKEGLEWKKYRIRNIEERKKEFIGTKRKRKLEKEKEIGKRKLVESSVQSGNGIGFGLTLQERKNRKWEKEKGEREIGKGYGTWDMGTWDMACRKEHAGTWEGITCQVNE